jgi:hypothetical protein
MAEMDQYWKVFLLRMVMFIMYFFGGAAIFMVIEKGDANYSQFNKTATLQEIRQNMTNNMSDNQFNDLVQNIVETATHKPNTPWKYKDSLTFAMHLLTTIGNDQYSLL